MRAYLDSLSPLPGAILYRAKNFWKALPPGLPGQILSLNSEKLPYWRDSRAYTPAFMLYNGSASYHSRAFTSVGNAFTCTAQFLCIPKAGTSGRFICTVHNSTSNMRRLSINVLDESNPTGPGILFIQVRNSAGTVLLSANSPYRVDDNAVHNFWIAFNGVGPQHFIRLDGNPLTPGTLVAGTPYTGAGQFEVGNFTPFTNTKWDGQLGFFGYKDQYRTNYSDFWTPQRHPKNINESTWQEWGGQPAVWSMHGDLANNWGSAGAFTRNGQIFVGNAGNL